MLKLDEKKGNKKTVLDTSLRRYAHGYRGTVPAKEGYCPHLQLDFAVLSQFKQVMNLDSVCRPWPSSLEGPVRARFLLTSCLLS